MKWDYWLALYLGTHCTARGLSSKTIAAYQATLGQFRTWLALRCEKQDPSTVAVRDALTYLEYLRSERQNGNSAVNRQLTVLKNFYRAIVAMGHLEPDQNPLVQMPRIKGPPRKLPVFLTEEEVVRLLAAPAIDTVLGVRDRALLAVLYGTGIRASECASLREADVDLVQATIRVTGKGGHERVIPLNSGVIAAMATYRQARGTVSPETSFFQSLRKRPMSRGAVYERVRHWSQRAKLTKRVSPHTLRHTFATHLLKTEANLVTIRDLLGHRFITSTQIYMHVTAIDLREAVDRHPISRFTALLERLLPDVKLPVRHPPVKPAQQTTA